MADYGEEVDHDRYDVEEIGVYSDMDEEEVREVEGLMAEQEGAGFGAGGGDGRGGGGGDDPDMADFRMAGKGGGGGGPPPEMQLRAGEGGKSANTGPKGVKADYEEAKRNAINTHMRETMRAARRVREQVLGKQEFAVHVPELPTEREEARKARKAGRGRVADKSRVKTREEHEREEAAAKDSDEDSSDLSGLSDDEDTFNAYKMQRLQYFHDSLPSFGTFERVSVEGIAAALKKTHDSTVTIVHLYENDLETCTALNLVFEDIAPSFKHVQFVRCRATEAMPNFKKVGLPALMIYRGTEQVDTMLRFVQPLGRNFSDADVVARLEEKKLLSLPMPTLGQLSQGYTGR